MQQSTVSDGSCVIFKIDDNKKKKGEQKAGMKWFAGYTTVQ